jgi:anti-anti-sigma regulatory factor
MEVQKTQDSDVTIFTLDGNLYGENPSCYNFVEEFRRTVKGEAKKVLVDLKYVEKINSCGIGTLASVVTSGLNAEAVVHFCDMNERLTMAVTAVHLIRMMKVFPDLDEAMKAFSAI